MPNWIESLIGALIGGGLSALGAWLAIGRQFKLHNHQTDHVARSFFAFLLDEQLRSVNSLIEYRALNSNQIAYFDIEKLRVNYSMFERNKEWLVRISDLNIRRQIIDAVSGLQLWTGFLLDADKGVNDAKRQLLLSEPGSPNHIATTNEIENAKGRVDGLFGNLSTVRQHIETVIASLTSNQLSRRNG